MPTTAAALHSEHWFSLFWRVLQKKNLKKYRISVWKSVFLLHIEEIGVTTAEQVETIAKNACVPGETIHNLAGDVQPVELYDAILQADAMGKLALGK